MPDKFYDPIVKNILTEIEVTLSNISSDEASAAINRILAADRIFIAGAGRSRLIMSAFAMRLMHIGLSVYMVGDVTTPAITNKDLLLIASGSRKTSTMGVICAKAKDAGAKTGIFTANPQEKLGSISDFTVTIPAAYKQGTSSGNQIGASTFEETLLIFTDALTVKISEKLLITDKDSLLWKHHSNLE